MVVIWGLDLREMQWGKFKSSYMFGNTDYHLRRTKFVVYQLAMIFCVVSESLGTAVLSDYLKQQDFINKLNRNALEYNDDYVGVGSYNIFVGVYVATIFGSGFFFDLFWPERRESRSVIIAWKVCSVLACAFSLGVVISLTIITSSKSASVSGVDAQEAERLLKAYAGSPLKYSQNGRAVASLVFAWLGFPSVIASTIVMWNSLAYTDTYGPFSSHAARRNQQPITMTSKENDQEMAVSASEPEPKPEDISPPAAYPPARVEGESGTVPASS